jgi:biotin transporter BioY
MNRKILSRIKKMNIFFQWLVLLIGTVSILALLVIWLYYQP